MMIQKDLSSVRRIKRIQGTSIFDQPVLDVKLLLCRQLKEKRQELLVNKTIKEEFGLNLVLIIFCLNSITSIGLESLRLRNQERLTIGNTYMRHGI